MAETSIETARLILRDWREEDWPEFFRVTNTPAVMRWLGGVLDDDGMAKQRGRVEDCHAVNGFCFWAVERKDDGALLGFCGIKRADAPGSTVTARSRPAGDSARTPGATATPGKRPSPRSMPPSGGSARRKWWR